MGDNLTLNELMHNFNTKLHNMVSDTVSDWYTESDSQGPILENTDETNCECDRCLENGNSIYYTDKETLNRTIKRIVREELNELRERVEPIYTLNTKKYHLKHK